LEIQFTASGGTLRAKRVGLDDKGRICLVVEEEKPFFVAFDEEGKQVIRKTRKVRKLLTLVILFLTVFGLYILFNSFI
jgi:hypothetical protein